MTSDKAESPIFKKAVIVGVGLLGGSIGCALRHRGLAQLVVGVGRPGRRPIEAISAGAVDQVADDLADGARDADLVICCAPVQQIPDHVAACGAVMDPQGLITDVGSTKRTIVERVDLQASQAPFVGSHPLAGGSTSGCQHARADLLEGSLVVITPSDATPASLVQRAQRLWQLLGAHTLTMSAQDHDQALAQTSHLPHIVAAALASATPRDLLPLTASGWRSSTRIAAGNAQLWRQILEENRLPALQALKNFAKVLEQWLQALETADGQAMEKLLEDGKATRDALGS